VFQLLTAVTRRGGGAESRSGSDFTREKTLRSILIVAAANAVRGEA